MSRFIYADPALAGESGHHANFCRQISSIMKEQGHEVIVLGSSYVSGDLRRELNVVPFFRVYTYSANDEDPVCGWLNDYVLAYTATREDLGRLYDLRESDVLFWSSALPPQLAAVTEWLYDIPQNLIPTTVVELASGPGVEVRWDRAGLMMGFPDPRWEPRPALFKFVAATICKLQPFSLRLVTFDKACSSIYSGLLGTDVGTLPWPSGPVSGRPKHSSNSRPTVAFLGHQSIYKGYFHVPDIARRLLSRNRRLRVLVHNSEQSDPNTWDKRVLHAQRELEKLAIAESRLALDFRAPHQEGWKQLLDAADLIVCPYDARRYATCHSGIVAEAIAEGIPIIVPGNTVLEQMLDVYDAPKMTFTDFNPDAISGTIEAALDRIDELSAQGESAAQRWRSENGAASLASALYAIVREVKGNRSPAPSSLTLQTISARLGCSVREREPNVSVTFDVPAIDRRLCPLTLPMASTAIGASKFFFSYWKSGSVLLENIIVDICTVARVAHLNVPSQLFADGLKLADVDYDWSRLFNAPGFVYFGFREFEDCLPVGPGNRCAVMVRDPRDMLVSLYYSHLLSHSIPDVGPERERMLTSRREAKAMSIDEYCLYWCANYSDKFKQMKRNYGGLLRRAPVLKYEDFIFDKESLIKRICEIIGVVLPADIVGRIAKRHHIVPEVESPGAHIRRVRPGDHVCKLQEETISLLNERLSDFLEFYGYTVTPA